MSISVNAIKYTDLDERKVIFKNAVIKTSKDQSVTYWEIPIKYMYNNGEDDLLIDGPMMTSNYGARLNKNKKWGMTFVMNKTKPDIMTFVEKMMKIYQANVKFIANTDTKDIIKIKNFRENNADEYFSAPIFQPADEKGNVIEGKDRLLTVRLIVPTYDGSTRRTLFTDFSPEMKPIDFSFVQNCQITGIPRFHISHDYVGTKQVILQIKLISMVVCDIVSAGTISQQVDVAKEIRESDPNKLNKLKDQLATIMANRKNGGLTSFTETTTSKKESEDDEDNNSKSTPPPGIKPGSMSIDSTIGRYNQGI